MPWYQHAWDLLLQSALTSLAIGVLATLAVAVCRQPARRIRIIECSLAACVLAPCLGLLPAYPRWRLTWPTETAVDPMAKVRAVDTDHLQRSPRVVAEAEGNHTARPDLPRHKIPGQIEQEPSFRVSTRAWIGGCYLVGAGGLLLWWMLGLAAWLRLVRSSAPAPVWVQDIWRQMTGPATNLARLVVSPRVSQPLTFTVLRPVVVLPSDLCQPGDERAMRWALRHEWSHAARGDAWSWSFATLVRALFWYQPLVWWLRSQLRLCQDFVADSAAAGQSAAVEDYAEFLTARMSVAPRIPTFAGLSIVGPARELSRRIVMLIDNERPLEPKCPRRWSVGFALAAVLVVALTAAVALGPNSSSGKDPKQSIATPPTEQVEVAREKKLTASTVEKARLRYGGKSFEEWQEVFATDLEPETRARALQAFGEFGANGYGPEAAKSIVEAAAIYDAHSNDAIHTQVTSAAYVAMRRLPSQEAVSALIGAAEGNRMFAMTALSQFQRLPKDAWPAILAAMDDTDADIRLNAVAAASRMDRGVEGYANAVGRLVLDKQEPVAIAAIHALVPPPPGETVHLGTAERPSPLYADELLIAFQSEDSNIFQSASVSLQFLGTKAAPAVPGLIAILRSERELGSIGSPRVSETLEILARIGPEAQGAVEEVLEYIRLVKRDPTVSSRAVWTIAGIGPNAAAAVPTLVKLVTDEQLQIQLDTIHALGEIGPDASEAVPTLNALTQPASENELQSFGGGQRQERLRQEARKALKKIQSPAE